MSGPRWRVGRKVGRTLYRDDEIIGLVDDPVTADAIVAAMNNAAAVIDSSDALKALVRITDLEAELAKARDIMRRCADGLAVRLRSYNGYPVVHELIQRLTDAAGVPPGEAP